MAQILPDVTFHGFDSFLGLQEDWQNQGVGHLGMDGKPPDHLPDNVTLHVGFFDQTLPVFSEAHRENIAFMHVDCDLYSSTVTILDAVSDKIQPGTVIMFDEYYTDDKGGDEARAYDEFVKKTDRRFRYISRHLHGGSVAVIIT